MAPSYCQLPVTVTKHLRELTSWRHGFVVAMVVKATAQDWADLLLWASGVSEGNQWEENRADLCYYTVIQERGRKGLGSPVSSDSKLPMKFLPLSSTVMINCQLGRFQCPWRCASRHA